MKSPVMRMLPSGVRTKTASASGIEWLTEMNSISKGPTRSESPSATTKALGLIRCSASLASTKEIVSRLPTSLMSLRSLRR